MEIVVWILNFILITYEANFSAKKKFNFRENSKMPSRSSSSKGKCPLCKCSKPDNPPRSESSDYIHNDNNGRHRSVEKHKHYIHNEYEEEDHRTKNTMCCEYYLFLCRS